MARSAKPAPAKAPAAPTPKVPAVRQPTQLPAEFADQLMADAGMGMSEVTGKDLAVPFFGIVQKLSPILDRTSGKYDPEAEEGNIYDNATMELFDGETGIVVLPCFYMRRHTEWKDRNNGGGLVRDYGADEAILAQTSKNDKNKDILPNGNEVVTAGTHYCLRVNLETGDVHKIILPMASTQLKKSKMWNTLLADEKVEANGRRFTAPTFYRPYRLTTVPESKGSQSWMGWKIEKLEDDDGNLMTIFDLPNGGELYTIAKDFAEQCAQGAVRVDPSQMAPENAEDPPY